VLTHAIAEPRTARSRRTRVALLAAARTLLEEHGFEGLSMTAVADTAGVTRRTAYLHFTARADLVGALYDYLAEAEGLADSLELVWSAPDAAAALDQWAAHLARYHPRLLAVDRALQRVRGADADAQAHYARVIAGQLENTRRLAQWLKREDRLAQPWTVASARDMLFALISSDLIGALIEDRNWSRQRLADNLAVVFRSTFVNEPSTKRRTGSRTGGGTGRG
jgi:AcrR family transcriptional regulator